MSSHTLTVLEAKAFVWDSREQRLLDETSHQDENISDQGKDSLPKVMDSLPEPQPLTSALLNPWLSSCDICCLFAVLLIPTSGSSHCPQRPVLMSPLRCPCWPVFQRQHDEMLLPVIKTVCFLLIHRQWSVEYIEWACSREETLSD